MKSPHLTAFQLCRRKAIEVLGEGNVYEYLPDEKAQYPFFFIGEMQGIDKNTKNASIPNIFQTVHYYSNTPFKRGTDVENVVNMMEKVRLTEKYGDFNIHCRNVDLRTMTDNTTETPLFHAVVDFELILF